MIAYAVLIGLAAYRGYRVLAEDTISGRFRDWLYDDAGKVRKFFADLFSCVNCIGWWYCGVGAALVAWQQDYTLLDFGILWCASSSIAGLTRATVNRLTT